MLAYVVALLSLIVKARRQNQAFHIICTPTSKPRPVVGLKPKPV